MEPTKDLADAIFRERVLRAREMPPEEKLFAGARIFERVCRIMKDGIRADFPQASPEEIDRILDDRLKVARRLEAEP